MKPKRYRAPKQQPGVLKAQWGKLRHEREDMCYAWGEECHSADRHMLNNFFYHRVWDKLFNKENLSFCEELEQRGYDIKTLRFSIKKKAT